MEHIQTYSMTESGKPYPKIKVRVREQLMKGLYVRMKDSTVMCCALTSQRDLTNPGPHRQFPSIADCRIFFLHDFHIALPHPNAQRISHSLGSFFGSAAKSFLLRTPSVKFSVVVGAVCLWTIQLRGLIILWDTHCDPCSRNNGPPHHLDIWQRHCFQFSSCTLGRFSPQ